LYHLIFYLFGGNNIPRGKPKKSDDEFYEESINFFYENGLELKKICLDCTDEYNDHSLLKLISITYWVGIFSPIAHKQLRSKYGYEIAYVDSMAGSGVTSTKRAKDYLCGSCPGAILSAKKSGHPFDRIIAVEINKEKAKALEQRLISITPESNIRIFNKDILQVSDKIASELDKKTISYIVIDPEGFEGMTWNNILPLLKCKGDAMITWFEAEAWRLKEAALTPKSFQGSESIAIRLNELFGEEIWKKADSPQALTDLFCKRVLTECGKTYYRSVKIPRDSGKYYLMILFTGKFVKAKILSQEWKGHLERRINSAHGKGIATLLDVKAGRKTTLYDF
jgi:three-Cys-motif partner protein